MALLRLLRVATVCATGGAILFIPHWILYHAIDQSFKRYEPAFDDDGHPLFDENHERVQVAVIDRPIAHFCLLTVLNVGTIIGSIMIGAAIFAAFANPIGLCVLAGTITALVAAAAIVFLYGLCFGGVAAVAAAENQQGGGLAAMGYRNRYDDGEGDEDIAQARLNPQLNQHGLFREQGDGPIHVVDDVRIRRENKT